MGSNASKLMATGLAAAMLAAVPAGASAKTVYQPSSVSGEAAAGLSSARHLDYSRNSVNGEDHAVTVRGESHLDYSRNSVSGEDNAVTPSSPSSPVASAPVRVVSSAAGFSWGAAAAGAGAMLLLALALALAGTRVRRRRDGTVQPASPMMR